MFKYVMVLIAVLFFATSCTTKVNESIVIPAGQSIHKNLYTVNGNIVVGPNSTVNGSCATVNGRVVLKANSTVKDIKSVNGEIIIGKDSRIQKGITVINGAIRIDSGAVVLGKVTTVNGSLNAANAHLFNDIATANGDIFLTDHTILEGNIVIKGKSAKDEKRKVEIFLKNGSEIKGNIRSKAPNTQVVVHALSGSKIDGDVVGAEIVYE